MNEFLDAKVNDSRLSNSEQFYSKKQSQNFKNCNLMGDTEHWGNFLASTKIDFILSLFYVNSRK